MEIVSCVFWVLVLISLIALPFLHRANEKKERMELFSNWERWIVEEEAEKFIDTLGQKINETIENKLNEMFQEE